MRKVSAMPRDNNTPWFYVRCIGPTVFCGPRAEPRNLGFYKPSSGISRGIRLFAAEFDVFHSNNFSQTMDLATSLLTLIFGLMMVIDWWLINESWRIHKFITCIWLVDSWFNQATEFHPCCHAELRNLICVAAVSHGIYQICRWICQIWPRKTAGPRGIAQTVQIHLVKIFNMIFDDYLS